MVNKIIVPGLHNSDPQHWQSHLERQFPQEYMRILQEDWDRPNADLWVPAIERQLQGYKHEELILIGHSIGCIAIVKCLEQYQHLIKGALLVAPSDAEQANFPDYIRGFKPIPLRRLGFPSIVVASDNDHVTSLERARFFAQHWGSKLEVLKSAGHIESASGFGPWPLGRNLIRELDSSANKGVE